MSIPPEEAEERCAAFARQFAILPASGGRFTLPARGASVDLPGDRVAGWEMIIGAILGLSPDQDPTDLHTLKAEFLRLGDPDAPVSFDVTPLRDTRNFVTRSVRVSQESGTLAQLTLGYSSRREGFAYQHAVPPPAHNPEAFPEMWEVAGIPARRPFLPGSPVETRFSHQSRAGDPGRPSVQAQLRPVEGFSSDPALRAAIFAGNTEGPISILLSLHLGLPIGAQASLDHQVWFHRPLAWNGWHTHEIWSDVATANRALIHCRIWDEQGDLLATVAQEVTHRT